MDKIQTIEKLFFNILTFSYLLLPIALVLKYKNKNWIGFVIALYGIFFFLLNTLYEDFPKGYKKYYFPIYTYFEFLTFSLILWANIPIKKVKIVIITTTFLFAIFQAIFLLTVKINKLDAVPIGIETIIIFVYVFIFFYSRLNAIGTEYIYNNYCFWISIGLLIYLGGSFFLNILANHISNIESYWHYTYIAEIIKNISFTVALFLIPRKLDFNSPKKEVKIPYLDMI